MNVNISLYTQYYFYHNWTHKTNKFLDEVANLLTHENNATQLDKHTQRLKYYYKFGLGLDQEEQQNKNNKNIMEDYVKQNYKKRTNIYKFRIKIPIFKFSTKTCFSPNIIKKANMVKVMKFRHKKLLGIDITPRNLLLAKTLLYLCLINNIDIRYNEIKFYDYYDNSVKYNNQLILDCKAAKICGSSRNKDNIRCKKSWKLSYVC